MVFSSHAEAKAAAEAAGLSFIGFGPDGAKFQGYVLVDPEASPAECRNAAFEAMRGRPIDHREELLLTLVEARSAE